MTQKKVLVADRVAQEGVDVLRQKGYEVDVKLDMTPEELKAAVAPYDAIIVRSATHLTREAIEAAENCKIIGRAGVGVDTIDLDAATERGIIVCNAPTSNIMSAAEHTMALMLACARQLPQANASMHAGKWDRADFMGLELYDKTLAIFGLGRIGGLVAERARAFGMHLIAFDPYCSPERADQLGVELYDSMEDILPKADFITVHLPRTPETIGMFGPNEFAAMKDGVVLVNAARGGIYQLKPLSDFIAAGKIFACGIDMFEEEPCTQSPLHEFDNALLTPHLGASTREAQVRAGVQIAEYVASGLEGSIVPTALNMTLVAPEVMTAVGPYVPACQMMGRMIAQILGTTPKTLKVVAAGSIANADPSILVAGTLDGILSYKRAGSVTPVNVEQVASRHGIKVDTSSMLDADEYASAVKVYADGVEVGATLFGSMQRPRIMSLMDYKIDIAPAKQSLVFEYHDAPGRIGTIGTVLGKANINITTMQIGTKIAEKKALVYMNVEGDVDESVLKELESSVDFENVWSFSL